jgi:hypothetical protein
MPLQTEAVVELTLLELQQALVIRAVEAWAVLVL